MPLPRRAAGAFISIPHWPFAAFVAPCLDLMLAFLDVLLNIKHCDGDLLRFKSSKVDSAAPAAILLQCSAAQWFFFLNAPAVLQRDCARAFYNILTPFIFQVLLRLWRAPGEEEAAPVG